MADEKLLEAVLDLTKWLKVACHHPVKSVLENALPDSKSRQIYQMTKLGVGRNEICKALKVGSKLVSDVQQKCIVLSLMRDLQDGRERVFDLNDFGLVDV